MRSAEGEGAEASAAPAAQCAAERSSRSRVYFIEISRSSCRWGFQTYCLISSADKADMMNAIRNVRLANFQIAQRKSAAAEKAAKQARDDACIIEMHASHAWCRAPGATGAAREQES